MSLINQMLTDLDQREVASVNTPPISGEVRAVSVVKKLSPTSLMIFVAGILIIGAVSWLYISNVEPTLVTMPLTPKIKPAPLAAPLAAQATPSIVNSTQRLNMDIEPKPTVPRPTVAKKIANNTLVLSSHSVEMDLHLSPALPDTEHFPAVTPALNTHVKSLQINATNDNTRIIFELSSIPQYQVVQYINPNRLVIDLVNTYLTKNVSLPKQKPEILVGLRTAVRNKQDVRLVFDLNDSVTQKNFTLKANKEHGPRLVVDFSVSASVAAPVTTPVTGLMIGKVQTVDIPSKVLPDTVSKFTKPITPPGKTTNAIQQSDNKYRQSVTLLRQGRMIEAQNMLRQSLAENSYNLKARQALVGLLVDSGYSEEASQWLKDGLALSPEQSSFSMALARIQIELGDSKSARNTLESGLLSAGEEANYHAFYAALLQRDGQHDTAIQHYLTALRTNPAMPTWLIGIGISLQTQGNFPDATAAYQRARDTGQLTPQLTQFVEARLKQIKPAAKSW